MFLTIGEKIRQARDKYGLKQIAFESYGFSRNYISMIETDVPRTRQTAIFSFSATAVRVSRI